MSNASEITLTIDGEPVDFIRKDALPAAPAPNGPLSLVVLTSGWIFVGRFDGEVITECHNVRSWSSVGYGGLSQGAKHSKAKLDKCRDVAVNAPALLFSTPLAEGWHDA